MDTPLKPIDRAKKFAYPVSYFLLAILILDILFIQFTNMGWIGRGNFSIWVAPPVEEAIKGGLGSLFGILYLVFYKKCGLKRFRPITWAVLAGVGSGMIFALSESLMQGESTLAIGTGLYTHPVWTTGVTIGCWSFIFNYNKRFLTGIYPLAVLGHISWNYFVLNQSNMARNISALLVMAVILVIFLRYNSDRLSLPDF